MTKKISFNRGSRDLVMCVTDSHVRNNVFHPILGLEMHKTNDWISKGGSQMPFPLELRKCLKDEKTAEVHWKHRNQLS